MKQPHSSTVIRRVRQRGQALIEFTFVGIPMIFILISIFEMSRGMWMYHTLAYAAKVGVRNAIVHGQDCWPNYPGGTNLCAQTIAQNAQVIQDAGVGLDPNTTIVTFRTFDTSGTTVNTSETVSCNLRSTSGGCQTNSTIWPPPGGGPTHPGSNQKGYYVEIQLTTPFRSAIALFWPGTRVASVGAITLPASSKDQIQF